VSAECNLQLSSSLPTQCAAPSLCAANEACGNFCTRTPSRLLVDDFPSANRENNLGEVARIIIGIGGENDEVAVHSLCDSTAARNSKELSRIGCKRCKNVAPGHSGLRHILIFVSRLIDLCVSDIGSEKDRAAEIKVALEL